MLISIEEYRKIVGIKNLPNLHLEVSLGCNISCEMCTFHDELKKFQLMPYDEVLKINSGFDLFGNVHIGDGSEPFINPNLLEIVKFFYKNGVKVSVQTNGKLIKTAGDAEKIVKSGLNYLQISLDGVSDEAVSRIRGGLSFKKISNAIQLINDAKQKLGSSTPYLGSNAVAMLSNLQEMTDLARFLLDNRFILLRIGFLELRKQNNNLVGDLLIYDIERTLKIIDEVRQVIKDHEQPMFFEDSIFKLGLGELRRENCTGYLDRLYVNYSGDMWTCYGKEKIGNIFKDGLSAIMFSDKYNDYKAKVTVPGNPICERCTFCSVMSLDKVTDHFGRNAINYYTRSLIDESLEYVDGGGDSKIFWKEMLSVNNKL